MRFWALIRRLFGPSAKAKASAARLDAADQSIAALASSQAAMTKRLNELSESLEDLVRQVGLQQQGTQKQLGDVRAIITQMGEAAKQARPAVARSMADVRSFMGDE